MLQPSVSAQRVSVSAQVERERTITHRLSPLSDGPMPYHMEKVETLARYSPSGKRAHLEAHLSVSGSALR